jgi:uncharacterized protein (DUF1015 family)
LAQIIPFRAIRPTRDKAYHVASRSYVSYTHAHLHHKLSSNPYSFIHIINPEFFKKGYKQRGIKKFEKVREKLQEWREKGIFFKEEKPSIYLYEQIKSGKSFTGVICGIHVNDYHQGRIKKHESTLRKREMMFKDYLQVTGFNAEPVLLTYPHLPGLDALVEKYKQTRAEYEYASTDEAIHHLWVIDDEKDIEAIQAYFKKVKSIYIADGHHRCSSSALLAETLNGGITQGNAPHDYLMAYLIPDDGLSILDFNRLVKSDKPLHSINLLQKLEAHFNITPMGKQQQRPSRPQEMTMYTDGLWYTLQLKKELLRGKEPLELLDAQLLTDYILKPVFGIEDLKNDQRIYFMDGTHGMDGLQKEVDKKRADVAFALYPVQVEQLKYIADHNLVMPPKSTYIEPKMRSGMLIYPLEE